VSPRWPGRAWGAAAALALDQALGEPPVPTAGTPVSLFGSGVAPWSAGCTTTGRARGGAGRGRGRRRGAWRGPCCARRARPATWRAGAGAARRGRSCGPGPGRRRSRRGPQAAAVAGGPRPGRAGRGGDRPGGGRVGGREHHRRQSWPPRCGRWPRERPGRSCTAPRTRSTRWSATGTDLPALRRRGRPARRRPGLGPGPGHRRLVAPGRPRRAGSVARAVRRDAPAPPVPNAGVAEAAFAAALGCSWAAAATATATSSEARPPLGAGRPPRPATSRRGRPVPDVTWLLAGMLAAAGGRGPRRGGGRR
jgi:hypothetical protein